MPFLENPVDHLDAKKSKEWHTLCIWRARNLSFGTCKWIWEVGYFSVQVVAWGILSCLLSRNKQQILWSKLVNTVVDFSCFTWELHWSFLVGEDRLDFTVKSMELDVLDFLMSVDVFQNLATRFWINILRVSEMAKFESSQLSLCSFIEGDIGFKWDRRRTASVLLHAPLFGSSQLQYQQFSFLFSLSLPNRPLPSAYLGFPPMPQDSSEPDLDDPDLEFVEVDPTGRYGRYKEVLGKGAFKKVYRGFDELEGIEVAWNQVKVADLLRNSEDMERLYSEVHLLKTLKHKNIIKFYNSWIDSSKENINFITEIFTSGTLRQYRKKHKHVDLRALKKWSRQILEGLFYLHSHDPPVIHRDLKCDNIFVNGNQGEVKIGDLGLAAILQQANSAHSVIGTPEFMAPELYEEEYNELVDIYAFGMCLLELVTVEYPYVECTNAAQIYKKVTCGIKPASLAKVANLEVRAFIEKCIAHVSERLSAKDLLMHPFLQSDCDNESVGRSLRSHNHDSGNNWHHAVIGENGEDNLVETRFTVEGQRRDNNTIFLKLRIADSSGHIRNIHFPFDIEADTSTAVASEMVEELELTDQDVTTIARMIDSEIQYHIPSWNASETPVGSFLQDSGCTSETRQLAHPMTYDSVGSPGSLALEILPSGRKYWSDSPKGFGANSPSRHATSFLSHEVDANADKGSPSTNDDISADDCSAEKECAEAADSPSCETSVTSGATGEKSSEKELSENLEDAETEYINQIATKLDNLLVKQRVELDELKRKHTLAVLDLLEELSPEMCQKVLDKCNLQMRDLNASL
ncbi:hypothetical protein Fmac_000959 [Flemingia macrophylla]|uniref:non-specific serine/threonine protein kinase n=1 Tax=Flemingia macrophylla TaxID=520843 RepID=A0ABD1NFR5_9FABA